MKLRPDTVDAAVAAATLSATLFFFAPAAVYFTNVFEFPFLFGEAAPYLAAGTLAGAVAAFDAWLICGARRRRCLAVLCAAAVVLWLQAQVFVEHYGVLDGGAIDWSRHEARGVLELAVAAGALAFAWARPGFFAGRARALCAFLLAAQTLALVATAAAAPRAAFKSWEIDEGGRFSFSAERNVVILVLDAFQSDRFHALIEEEPALKNRLSGFTYFRNATAGFPTTYASPTLILTGLAYDNREPIHRFMRRAFLSDGSLPLALKRNGFASHLYPDRLAEIHADPQVTDNLRPRKPAAGEAARGAAGLAQLGLFRAAPHFAKRAFFGDGLGWIPRGGPLQSAIPIEGSAGDIRFLKRLEAEARADSPSPVLKYYHLWGAHGPHQLRRDLTLKPQPAGDAARKEQERACLEIVDRFIGALRRIGVYGRTDLFVLSDHGAARPVDVPRDFPFAESGEPEADRGMLERRGAALALVLWKPAGREEAPFAVSDAPVTLGDVPATVGEALGLGRELPGVAMTRNSEPADRPRLYRDYRWEHRFFDSDYLPPMKEYVIRGHAWLESSWSPSAGAEGGAER